MPVWYARYSGSYHECLVVVEDTDEDRARGRVEAAMLDEEVVGKHYLSQHGYTFHKMEPGEVVILNYQE
jgi:hypothetical protein